RSSGPPGRPGSHATMPSSVAPLRPALVRLLPTDPQAHRLVIAGGGEALAVRAEGHVNDRVRVPCEDGDLLPRLVPQTHRTITTGGGEALAVRAEGHVIDLARVPFEYGELLAG